jgi:hypothetical protein
MHIPMSIVSGVIALASTDAASPLPTPALSPSALDSGLGGVNLLHKPIANGDAVRKGYVIKGHYVHDSGRVS